MGVGRELGRRGAGMGTIAALASWRAVIRHHTRRSIRRLDEKADGGPAGRIGACSVELELMALQIAEDSILRDSETSSLSSDRENLRETDGLDFVGGANCLGCKKSTSVGGRYMLMSGSVK